MLRAKIVGSVEQQEETTALLKRTGDIVEKLMDENAMLRIERRRLVEEFMDAFKQHLEDKKELIAARPGDVPAACSNVEISEPDRCIPSSFALVYFGHCRMWLY